MTRSHKHKKSKTTKVVAIVLAVLFVLVAGGYTYRSTYYSDHFLPNTKIDKIDISNKTVAEANELLHEQYASQEFTIAEKNSEWKKINLAQFGLQTDFTKELKALKEDQNQWSWGMAYVSAAENSELTELSVDQTRLTKEVAAVKGELDELNKTRTQTQDATLNKSKTGFAITPEVVGDAIDTETFAKDLTKAITTGEKQLDLSAYQKKPTITKSDAKLNEEMNSLNKIAQTTANYSINGEVFQIPSATIMDWLSYKDGATTIDEVKVRAYVTELGAKYNTSTNSSTFHSTKRGEVTVPAGTLSWTIQPDEETAALITALKAGEDFTRTPIVQGSTNADAPLFSKTYIEVDLENQHMWYYKDGKVALETDIVSGKPTTKTPTGVFYVWNKERNATLKGTNDDGSKYESPVDYWMPINWTGVGIHDSAWQPEYGGELWKTRGSHGCVNTPPGVMKTLFETVEVGTPVIVI